MSPSRKGSEKGVDRFLRINESHSNMTVSRCSSAVERHPMKSNVHRYLGKALNKRKQKYTKITLSLCQLVSSGKTWFVNMAELWTTLDNFHLDHSGVDSGSHQVHRWYLERSCRATDGESGRRSWYSALSTDRLRALQGFLWGGHCRSVCSLIAQLAYN